MKKFQKIFSLVVAMVAASSMVTAFGCGGNGDKKGDKTDITVYAPDGAPALAIAKMLAEDTADDGVRYKVVQAASIAGFVDFKDEQENADICILPLNLASKKLGDGARYQLLGAVTHGNIYMLSTDETGYSQANLSALIGKTVGVVQLNNVPGLTFQAVLKAANVPYQIVGNDGAVSAEKVNLKAVTPEAVKPTPATDGASGIDVFVAPEPAASVKVDKTALNFVGDVQELYGGLIASTLDGAVAGVNKGYPQAAIVAKKRLIESNSAFIEEFTAELTASAEWLATAEIATICNAVSAHLPAGVTPSLTTANLSRGAIERSGVRFEAAFGYKTEINEFLARLIDVDGTAASAVSDLFFYQAD